MAKPTTSKTKPGWVVPAALVAMVTALFLVAAVATRIGGGGGDAGDADVAQTRPVSVAGPALPGFAGQVTDPAVGTVAPRVTGATFAGSPVQIGGTGRPAMVFFVAHWCPHCRKEVPLLAPALGRITPPGVDVLTVSTSVRQGAAGYPPSEWLEDQGWPTPVLADDTDYSAASAYGLTSFPYYVLLDGAGKVVARDSGEKTVAEVEALLTQVIPKPG